MGSPYQKVFAITGPESTGKSMLCARLAKHYKTVFVPEQSRVYLSRISRHWNYTDVLEIAKMQTIEERNFRSQGYSILFCDTELIAIKVWLEFYHMAVPEHIIEQIENDDYTHYLLMNIDVPWEPDPLRQNPNDRQLLFSRFVQELNRYKKPFTIISGLGDQRFKHAIDVIERLSAECAENGKF